MIIGVAEKNGDKLNQRVRKAIWKYRNYFQTPDKPERVAVAVTRNGGLPVLMEVLPGKRAIQETMVSLHDLLPGLPEAIRAEIVSAG